LHLAAGAAALPTRFAWAQTYPSRPVHIIVGYPAGNAPDIITRLTSQWLSERLGQQFIVENRPGAGSNIATEAVVNAPADGYTLLMAVRTDVINATLYGNLKFNFIRDIAPVASIANAPFVMVITQSFAGKTVPELIAYAKAHPGKINMASPGNGTSPHVVGELFKTMAGVDLVHVPYRGSYMPDLLGGEVQVAFSPTPLVIEYVRTGKLPCGDHCEARRGATGHPHLGRICAGLRGDRLVWNLRAQKHTHRGSQQAQRSDQRRSRRTQNLERGWPT
jgi:tripartite-type tricarboxylate transporter receptor subunit TctC